MVVGTEVPRYGADDRPLSSFLESPEHRERFPVIRFIDPDPLNR